MNNTHKLGKLIDTEKKKKTVLTTIKVGGAALVIRTPHSHPNRHHTCYISFAPPLPPQPPSTPTFTNLVTLVRLLKKAVFFFIIFKVIKTRKICTVKT